MFTRKFVLISFLLVLCLHLRKKSTVFSPYIFELFLFVRENEKLFANYTRTNRWSTSKLCNFAQIKISSVFQWQSSNKKNGSVVEQPNYTHFISCTGTHWARSKYEKNVIWFQVSLSKIAAALYFLLSVSPLLLLLSSSLRCVHLHLFTLVVSSFSFCPTELCHITLVLRLKTETMQTIYTKFANAVCPVAAAWKAYF